MNSDNPPIPVEVSDVKTNPVPPNPPAMSWVKRFLWRNPFYLASAALFLLGINQLSLDPSFFASEERKLLFNFSALQGYEILLVVIALFLAARRIWYDSTLLAVLESGFVLVQFILLSHAALIGGSLAWGVGLAGTVLAFGRYGSLKRWFPQLNLPLRLLACGIVMLLANLSLPFFFRWTLEDATPDWDDMSAWFWLWPLPALQLMANLLPKGDHSGRLDSQRPWLPFLLLHLWIAGTAVHLRCLDYFSSVPFKLWLLTPLLWTLAWTVWVRLTDFVEQPSATLPVAALATPAVVPLLAALGRDSQVFLVVTTLNVLAYAALARFGRQRRASLELLLVSCAILFAGLPETWAGMLWGTPARGRCVMLSVAAYIAILSASSRSVFCGWAGAVATAFGFLVFGDARVFPVAVQAGFLFLLAHSLRWADEDAPTAGALRNLMAVLWVIHSHGWTYFSGSLAGWTVVATAVSLTALYGLAMWMYHRPGPIILPMTALMSISAPPLEFTLSIARKAPVGMLAVAGSLLLLAMGTAFALMKHRWHEPTPVPGRESEG